MRIALSLILAASLGLGGCVAAAVVGTAGAVVGTGVGVTGAVVGGGVDLVVICACRKGCQLVEEFLVPFTLDEVNMPEFTLHGERLGAHFL